MNSLQINKLAMGHAVSNSLETFPATGVPPALAVKHASLKAMMDNIHALALQQVVPLAGVRVDRDRVFEVVGDAAEVVGGAVLSYANAHRLGDLTARVRFALDRLRRARIFHRVQVAQQIHDAAHGVVDQLVDYSVTAATLTDLQTKVTAAMALLDATRTAVVSRTVATQGLARAFDAFEALLKDELDPLINSLKRTIPEAHARYRSARRIVDVPGSPGAEPETVVPAATLALAPTGKEQLAA
jgi:hypothetical protein